MTDPGNTSGDPELFVRALRYQANATDDQGEFPFSLDILDHLDLQFASPVTFLVGENGTGKSTVLESLAVATRCVAIGSADLERDPSLGPARQLARQLKLVRGRKPITSVFFRAEDAFGFVNRVVRESQALRDLEEEFRNAYQDGSLAQTLAMGAAAGQRQAFEHRYGSNPDAQSHGESFLHLLEERLRPKGLYLLDEPETPLSPLRILALMRLLIDRVDSGSQFFIATHSPMLMALPGATILQFAEGRCTQVSYDDVEHVSLTRAFLKSPDAFLRRLRD